MNEVERHRRLRQLFEAALELTDGDRRAFLDSECHDDPALRREVDHLLSRHAEDAKFLASPALGVRFRLDRHDGDRLDAPPRGQGITLELGRRIAAATDHYQVRDVLGQGAMATVFRAEQTTTGRTVALKVLRAGMSDRRLVARQQHEARILGRLHHPGIAEIYDAGVVDVGDESQPYFAMEYVEGRSIVDHADRARLPIEARLDLLARTADAVHHAHERGIVHRDLKPDNILVTKAGEPKILDFGVARATDADVRTATLQTAAGQLLGTVQYMSPEQAAGRAAAVDARSDVYALGVIGFELLGGRLPYDVDTKPLHEALRIIRDDDPTRLGTFDTALRGDVETVIGRALEKEPDRRYVSAKAFAEDVRRVLRDEPILAQPPTTLYQVRKFAHRHRVIVAAVAAVMIVLTAATALSLILAQSARRQRDLARWNAYVANVVGAEAALESGSRASAKALLASAPESVRNWEWFRLARRADASLLTLNDHDYWVWEVAFDPTGERFASAAGDSTVRIWDAQTGESRHVIRDHTGRVFSLAWSFDRTRLASGSSDQTIRLRDAATFETIAVLTGHAERIFALAFSPDSRRLVSGGADGRMMLWDAATGAKLDTLEGHDEWVWSVAFSPDGGRIASASTDDTIRLWDSEDGAHLATLTGHTGDVHTVAFSPDGTLLASGGMDATVRLWDAVRDNEQLAELEGHTDWIGAVAFTPAGTELLSAGNDTTIRAWDVETGALLRTLHGHEECARTVAVSPDGRRLVSGSFDSTLKVWDADTLRDRFAPRTYDGVRGFAFTADGRLVTRLESGEIAWLDPRTGLEHGRLDHEPGGNLVLSPDGSRLALRATGNRVRVVDVASGDSLMVLEDVRASCPFHPDSRRIAVARPNHDVHIVDASTGRVRAKLHGHEREVTSLAFSHDGALISTGSADETVRVWNVETGELIATIAGHSQATRALAFTPDGRGLVVLAHDRSLTLWDPIDASALVTCARQEAIPSALAIAPNGDRIATGDNNGAVRIWNLRGGEPLLTLSAHSGCVNSLAFSPDGTLLALEADRRLFVYDGRP